MSPEKKFIRIEPFKEHSFPELKSSIKTYLSKNLKTMGDLANHLEISRQSLYKQINAKKPNLVVLWLIADFLNCKIVHLLGTNDKRYDEPRFDKALPLVLKNRILRHLELREKNWDYVAALLGKDRYFIIEEIERIQRLEKIEHKDDKAFVKKVLDTMMIDYHAFFKIKGNTNSKQNIYPGRKRADEQKFENPEFDPYTIYVPQVDRSIEEITRQLLHDIEERSMILKDIIGYYVSRYGKDEVSLILRTLDSYDKFDTTSKVYYVLRDVMNKNME